MPDNKNICQNNSSTESGNIPEALAELETKYYAVAVVMTCAVAALALLIKEWKALAMLLFPLYFVWRALALKHDWKSGRIVRVCAVCINVRSAHAGGKTVASFEEDYDSGNCYQFSLPSDGADFVPGAKYTVFFDSLSPHVLLAHREGYVK